jgi:methionine-gamma-lyase
MTNDDAGNKDKAGRMEEQYNMRSRLIHGDMRTQHWDYSHHVVPPLSCSATYRLDNTDRAAEGFMQFGSEKDALHEILIYDRLHEPTSEMLEDRLREAERGGCAVTFSTGMAAISGALGALLSAGDHVVSHRCVYGCTHSLFQNWYIPRLNIGVTRVDMTDVAAVRAAIRPETRVLYLETPVNPTLDIIDLRALSDIIAAENAQRPAEQRLYSIVDNTFSTPACQRPLEHGIDIVVHSLTKGIGGFGTDMGGVVIAPLELRPRILLYRKDFGGSLSSKAAWQPLVYGLPTLHVRMRQMQESAGRIARYLQAHPEVDKVRYPGLETDPHHAVAQRQMLGYGGEFMPGSMIYFTLKDKPDSNLRAKAFTDHAAQHSYCMTLCVSLGQVKTLIENPSSMTHSALSPEDQRKGGIEPGGIRLSIGIESVDDLLRDLDACFAHIADIH